MPYKDKLEQAAGIAAVVFSHALKGVMDEDVPNKVKEVFTKDVCDTIGTAMAETIIGFFGEDILPVVIAEAKRYGDVKIAEVKEDALRRLEELAKAKLDEFTVPELAAEARLQLVGLEAGYVRPWWARWLGLPGKVKIIK